MKNLTKLEDLLNSMWLISLLCSSFGALKRLFSVNISSRSNEAGRDYLMDGSCGWLNSLFLRMVSFLSPVLLFFMMSQEFILQQFVTHVISVFCNNYTDLMNSNLSSFGYKYITLIDEKSREEWRLNSRILPFSEFLRHMSLQENDQDESNILTIQLPSFLEGSKSIMDLISKFYEMHEYNQRSVKLKKISINRRQQPFDSITVNFMQSYLQKQPSDFIKRLMDMTEYLKLNSFKEVLSTYVATQYYFRHNEKQMKRHMEENNIFYSRQMEINLKRGLLDYSKQLSKDLLQEYRRKQAKKRGIVTDN